ncbi:hypothetical protein [Paeniglutamicibacter kerguelensis]|uniref:Uncharacterized protein n=1 Tax=Paeniglutamicibacter kerguelensis TaxID=254788 RepID=A0ABS4X8V5_9MICC|nr:hypothetical protein [Paeniglutamicibacter kerguelensis]
MKKSLFIAGAVLLAILAIPLLDPLTRARVFTGVIFGGGLALTLLVTGILTALFGLFSKKRGVAVLGVVAAVVAVPLAFAASWNANVHLRDTVAVVSAEDELLPETGLRAPYLVAERQASSNSSGTVGDITGTTYLAGKNVYSTLVERRGWLGPGYETMIVQQLALTGQATGERCDFATQANRRMNGIFGNSLTRAIAGIDTGLIAKDVDTWGYCDNGTPKIVVPVTKLENWLAPRDVPAGVVVYNGSTDELEYRPEIASGELPGPAVSISQSRRVNASLATLNGDWWSTNILKSTGITDEPKDEDDTNLGSHSNFSMNYGEDRFGFFSPFTSRASSRTIDHVAVLDSSQARAGEHASAKLYTLRTPRQSNAATADKIKADYSSLSDWATGMAVMEIVPGGEGIWHASIGQKQNVNYRVQLNADGSSCLLTATGNKLRCSTDAEPAPGSSPEGNAGTGMVDPSGLSNEELKSLHEAIVKELHERLGNQ